MNTKLIAQKRFEMLCDNTPVDDHRTTYGLLVKREDLSCPPPGPPFSKTRGVFSHIAKRPESHIGVLDTRHSQGGHAVARACQLLGKQCVVFYPRFRADAGEGLRAPQQRAKDLGALCVPLQAGRSAVLFHQAKKQLAAYRAVDGTDYMMPNALKLEETVEETAAEVLRTESFMRMVPNLIVPASSATVAAGVIKGLLTIGWRGCVYIHLGYSRSHAQVESYVCEKAGLKNFLDLPKDFVISVVDEKYSYKDEARKGETPPWPCNPYYDLKAFRWWMKLNEDNKMRAMLWNVG